jgi:AraC-like DNA-binding protein
VYLLKPIFPIIPLKFSPGDSSSLKRVTILRFSPPAYWQYCGSFFPWGAYHFLGVPIKEVHNRVIDVQLTHIAQEFDYFDQSHFIREFKSYSGVTPKTFISDNNIVFVDI